jgi:hypothetical protein
MPILFAQLNCELLLVADAWLERSTIYRRIHGRTVHTRPDNGLLLPPIDYG